MEKLENIGRILVGARQRISHLNRRWDNNIKTDLDEVVC